MCRIGIACGSALAFAVMLLLCAAAPAQTTDGSIVGRVFGRDTGEPVGGAAITYTNLESQSTGSTLTNAKGFYTLLFLPPGKYRLGASAKDYQPRFLHELEVAVGARIELNFPGSVALRNRYRCNPLDSLPLYCPRSAMLRRLVSGWPTIHL